MRKNFSVKIYQWNVEGLNASDESGLHKRMEIKRMFKEGRSQLRANQAQIVMITLSGIDVREYSELSFRLQEFDLTKEIDKYGYDYFWSPSSTEQGGLILFWKAVDSTQVMISDKVLASAQLNETSQMTFAECSIVSKGLDSQIKLLVCAILMDNKQKQKLLDAFHNEIKNQKFDYFVIVGSTKRDKSSSIAPAQFNEILKPWSIDHSLTSPNPNNEPTCTYNLNPQDFIFSNGHQRDFQISLIDSYQVCQKLSEQSKEPTLKAKLYSGHFPLESTLRIPTNFQIIVQHKQSQEKQEELTINERKKLESYIDKLEKEIERLRGETKRKNLVIQTLQREIKERGDISSEFKKSEEEFKDLKAKYQESCAEIERMKQLDQSMTKEEIYTQTSLGEAPIITDRDSMKQNNETDPGESIQLKEVIELLELRNEELQNQNIRMTEKVGLLLIEVKDLKEKLKQQESIKSLETKELQHLRKRTRLGRVFVKLNWFKFFY